VCDRSNARTGQPTYAVATELKVCRCGREVSPRRMGSCTDVHILTNAPTNVWQAGRGMRRPWNRKLVGVKEKYMLNLLLH
jgi:hypothetical protein